MRIALINGPLESAVCDLGVGHQMPLGLLMVGGPLLDAGHMVRLIDAACEHLDDDEIARRVASFGAQVAMIAHVGSTAAHPACLRTLRAVKAVLPSVITVYGGVYPTYSYRQILAEHPEVDVIVRGEGEATTLELVCALAQSQAHRDAAPDAAPDEAPDAAPDDTTAAPLDIACLSRIPGLAIRRDGAPVCTG